MEALDAYLEDNRQAAYASAEGNTSRNADVRAVVPGDDEWRDGAGWDDFFEKLPGEATVTRTDFTVHARPVEKDRKAAHARRKAGHATRRAGGIRYAAGVAIAAVAVGIACLMGDD